MKKYLPKIIALGVYDAAIICRDSIETSARRVRMYEIELTLEDGGITHIDNSSYPIKAGNIIIGKPGQVRHTKLPFKCLYIHLIVEDDELDQLLRSMPDVYTSSSNELLDAFEHLITSYNIPETDAGMRLASDLCSFLSTLIKDTRIIKSFSKDIKKHSDIIECAIAYIDANLCQNITLGEIADHVYLSKIYFHKLFRSATGKTPYKYILERRLAYSQKLLMTTSMSVGGIAHKCGFSSHSYFNQVFQREIGCTPVEYKKKMSLKWYE